MHSVTLTEAAMHTDAESLTEGILLTADVSYLKAVMEVRGEIVRRRVHPVGRVPTAEDLDDGDREIRGTTNCRTATTRTNDSQRIQVWTRRDPGRCR